MMISGWKSVDLTRQHFDIIELVSCMQEKKRSKLRRLKMLKKGSTIALSNEL